MVWNTQQSAIYRTKRLSDRPAEATPEKLTHDSTTAHSAAPEEPESVRTAARAPHSAAHKEFSHARTNSDPTARSAPRTLNIDSDLLLILCVLWVLNREKADQKLIIALFIVMLT